MPVKKWLLPPERPEMVRLLAEEYGVSPFVAEILVNRGVETPAKAEDILGKAELSDPFLLPDMKPAVVRIQQAVRAQERIAVFGDYDCDGICAAAMVTRFLKGRKADVLCFIPEREEGYGLSRAAIERLHGEEISLLITVDNGISAWEEISYAVDCGMDVIVTDHHQVGDELPAALAVVNPQRKDWDGGFRQMCGAGIALQLLRALAGGEVAPEYWELAAVATVGDVVPLVSENRTIVKQGLSTLENSENPGLLALLEAAGLTGRTLTAEAIAFGVVPRINAAGRIGQANRAMELLLAEKVNAVFLAGMVNDDNTKRQSLQNELLETILGQISARPELLRERVLVLAGEGWHHGVLGIVSAKLLELFGKPNVLLSIEGEQAVGSARSIADFSLYDALYACQDKLLRFGGHRQAAGLQIRTEDIEAFSRQINQYAKTKFPVMPVHSYSVDKRVVLDEITVKNVESMECLQPFGAGNPSPVFLFEGVTVQSVVPLSGGKHVRFQVACGDRRLDILWFGKPAEQFPYVIGDRVDLLLALSVNEFRGTRSVSARLIDSRPSGLDVMLLQEQAANYETVKETGKATGEDIPTREKAAALYRYFAARPICYGEVEWIYQRACREAMSFTTFLLLLDIFEELGFIRREVALGGIFFQKVTKKVALEEAPTLRYLQQNATN